jgi:hypothetical protein
VAAHAGEVHHDAHGYAGYDVNLAFRLVDAQPLRAAMAASAAPVGLIVSEGVHDGVLRHGYGGLDPAAFQRVPVRVKTADVAGWIQLVSGGAEAATGPGADASATPGAPVPAPRQAALVVRTVESVDELVRLDPAEQGAAGVSGAASAAVSDATSGPVAVLLVDEASLLDELAGLGVRTVVLVGGAAVLAQTLAPIARQSIYIEHELIE